MNAPRLPSGVSKRLRDWKLLWFSYMVAHWTFGVGGVVASVIAGAQLNPIATTAASIFCGVSFAILGFVKPEAGYYKFVRSWRVLDIAVQRHEAGLIDVSAVMDAVERGEGLITEVEGRGGGGPSAKTLPTPGGQTQPHI